MPATPEAPRIPVAPAIPVAPVAPDIVLTVFALSKAACAVVCAVVILVFCVTFTACNTIVLLYAVLAVFLA